jgi:hypothetical protein
MVGISISDAVAVFSAISRNSYSIILGTSCLSMTMFSSSIEPSGSQSKQPIWGRLPPYLPLVFIHRTTPSSVMVELTNKAAGICSWQAA